MHQDRWRTKAGMIGVSAVALGLIAGFVLGMNSTVGAGGSPHARSGRQHPAWLRPGRPTEPGPFAQVFLGQPLSDNAPIFPGDPQFRWQLWNCVKAHPSVPRCQHGSGYTLEQIQSLGTHTGTHISAPCHFHESKTCLNRLPEKFFGLRTLLVINVKPLILARHGNGDFFITTSYIQNWLRRTGCRAIPQDSYVVLYTGLSSFYHLGNHRVPGRTTTTTTMSPASAPPPPSGSGSTARSASARTPSAPTPPWTSTSLDHRDHRPRRHHAGEPRPRRAAAPTANSTPRLPAPPRHSAAGSTSPAPGWAWTAGPSRRL